MGVVEEDSPVGYEEIRRKRIEENMKRMKELGLVELSRSLAPVKSCTPTKTVRRKMASSQDLGMEARRSSRVANKPPVDYRDQTDVPGLRARCGTRSDRQGLPRKYMSDKARMAAIDAADEVNKGLVNPAFVKPMLHSHTASGFWLGLPATFCKTHLPLKDDRIMLEDDQEREWETIYLAGKVGLSGGWRGFSLDHDLVDGDCCIFELVSSHRFKVHIFRAHELEFVDDDEEEGEGKVQDGDDVKGNKSSNAKKTSAAKTVGSKSAKKSTPKSPKLKDEADGEEATEKPTKLSSSTRPKKKGKAKDATRSLSANRRSRRISDSEDDEDQEDTDEEEDANEEDSDGGAPSTPSQKVKGERKNPLSRKRKSKVITLGSQDSEEEDDDDDDDDKWEPTASSRRSNHSRACRTPVRTTRNSGAR